VGSVELSVTLRTLIQKHGTTVTLLTQLLTYRIWMLSSMMSPPGIIWRKSCCRHCSSHSTCCYRQQCCSPDELCW